MKLAYCLDRTKRNAVVEIGHIDVNDKTFIIPLYYQEDAHFEDMHAGKHKKHLERAIGYVIELHYIPSSHRQTLKNQS